MRQRDNFDTSGMLVSFSVVKSEEAQRHFSYGQSSGLNLIFSRF